MIVPGNMRENYPIDPHKTLGMDAVMLARFAYDKAHQALTRARSTEGMQPMRPGDSRELQDRVAVVLQELDQVIRILNNYQVDEIHDDN